MSRVVLNHDLGLRAYKQRMGNLLTAALREQSVVKTKRLLNRYAGNGHRSMLYSDDKVFTVQQGFNAQNDRVYASSSQQLHVFPECEGPITQHQSWCGGV